MDSNKSRLYKIRIYCVQLTTKIHDNEVKGVLYDQFERTINTIHAYDMNDMIENSTGTINTVFIMAPNDSGIIILQNIQLTRCSYLKSRLRRDSGSDKISNQLVTRPYVSCIEMTIIFKLTVKGETYIKRI